MKRILMGMIVLAIAIPASLQARCNTQVRGESASYYAAVVCLMDERNEIEAMKMKLLQEQNKYLKSISESTRVIAEKQKENK